MICSLYFHHISDDILYYTNTKPQEFERKLVLLLEGSYTFVTPRFCLDENNDLQQRKYVILTFDDGYADQFINAREILKRYAIKATFFIITNFVGKKNSWNVKATYRSTHLTWKQIEILKSEGHEIGSHSATHRPLTTLSDEEIENEYFLSKSVIDERLGCSTDFFSYPYGLSPKRSFIQKYYKLAFSTVKSPSFDLSDPYFLRRDFKILD
ncbi:polysaccharide deacetylase family protein [Segetibacter sp. 3557_3]|uniref:polysaccharide deacetylase family protein n=1 Tax=Segetibacter sp. 3557_3 TaxID=2547429 RepID=UPI001058D0F3|nr:polysaccharide deacetylase family protein [Segetibacter sp. 3557_3]TDH18458.1 polysaccharide deacetylase family protein [Segetibacter sp. 3557_3]